MANSLASRSSAWYFSVSCVLCRVRVSVNNVPQQRGGALMAEGVSRFRRRQLRFRLCVCICTMPSSNSCQTRKRKLSRSPVPPCGVQSLTDWWPRSRPLSLSRPLFVLSSLRCPPVRPLPSCFRFDGEDDTITEDKVGGALQDSGGPTAISTSKRSRNWP